MDSAWHRFFATKLFGRLTVTPGPDFDQLRDMAHGQCAAIRHLWLRIPLAPYDCTQCNHPESTELHRANVNTVQHAIRGIVNIMMSWDPKRNGYPENVTLEISIHSWSDRCHGFAAYDFDAVPEGLEGVGPDDDPLVHQALSHHAFVHHPQVGDEQRATWRLFGHHAMDPQLPPSMFKV